MKQSKKANSAAAKNSAKLQSNGKAVMVEYYNHISEQGVNALLPANEETKALPYFVTKEIVDAMKAKYGEVEKQTTKAWEAMMKKMTREKFTFVWDSVRGIPNLREIKELTAMARTSEIPITSAPHFVSDEEWNPAITKFRFSRDGNYARIFAIIEVGSNTVFSRCIVFGRYNATKVSIDYDALDNLFCEMQDVFEELEEQREITVRLVRNGDGYDVILPKDLNVKEVRYE